MTKHLQNFPIASGDLHYASNGTIPVVIFQVFYFHILLYFLMKLGNLYMCDSTVHSLHFAVFALVLSLFYLLCLLGMEQFKKKKSEPLGPLVKVWGMYVLFG